MHGTVVYLRCSTSRDEKLLAGREWMPVKIWEGERRYIDSSCGRRAQAPKLFQSSLIADVIVVVSKDGPEERWLELWTGQCYGATCVPASIDK